MNAPPPTSVYQKCCPSCKGIGIAGYDSEGHFISGGVCKRCGGIGFIEYTVINGGNTK